MSEPEIRFSISFDVERCRKRGEERRITRSISSDVVRDFDDEVARREVNCAEDVARDPLIHSRRAKERIIFEGITVNGVGNIRNDDDQGSSMPN